MKIGYGIKISGAVSMDNEGNPTAIGDLEQQMKNAYSDLDKVLKHYGVIEPDRDVYRCQARLYTLTTSSPARKRPWTSNVVREIRM